MGPVPSPGNDSRSSLWKLTHHKTGRGCRWGRRAGHGRNSCVIRQHSGWVLGVAVDPPLNAGGVTRGRALIRKSGRGVALWGAARCGGFPGLGLGLWLGFSPAGAAAEQVLFLWIGPSHVFPTFALSFELISLGSKVFE